MNSAFFDTNILIANVFEINSNHIKSENVFKTYAKYYWSSYVKNEFKRRFPIKKRNLIKFFLDLNAELKEPKKDFYSLSDLNHFVDENFTGKQKKDIENSLKPFWNHYIGIQSLVPFYNIKNAVSDCLDELNIFLSINRKNIESVLNLTPTRTKKYLDIDAMLKSEGVKDEDRIVTLDSHDFACNSVDPIDFVTFDEECYFGARNVGILCFNSVKGKHDFNAS